MKIVRGNQAGTAVSGVCLAMILAVVPGCSDPTGQAQLERGLLKLEAGRYRSAAHSLEQAVERQSKSATAWYNLGVALWKLEKFDGAANAFEKAADCNPEDTRPLEFAARVYMELDRWADARAALDQARERDPSLPRIAVASAIVEFKAGEMQKAFTMLRKAVKDYPDYPPALYNLAVFYRDRLKNMDEARNYFGQYLELAADDPHADAARKTLLGTKTAPKPEAKPEPPRTPVTPAPPSKTKPAQTTQQAPQVTQKPPVPQKEPAKTGVVAEKPASAVSKPREDPFDKVLADARRAVSREAFDEALVLLNRAIQINPYSADARWELAVLYDKHMEFKESAGRAYTKFRELFPKDPRVASIPAITVQPPGAVPKPVAAPEPSPVTGRLPSIDRLDANEAFKKGLEHQEKQEWEKAIAQYDETLRLNPKYSHAAYNRGLAFKGLGNVEKAKDSFRQAVGIQPDMYKARYMLALAYREDGDRDKAVEELNQTLRIKPDYAEAHYVLGLIYRDSKRYDASGTHFERYIQLAPNGPSVATARKWLDKYKAQ